MSPSAGRLPDDAGCWRRLIDHPDCAPAVGGVLLGAMSGTRTILLSLLLAGAAVRVGWALHQPREIDARLPDQLEYLQAGKNLASGQGLWITDPHFGDRLYAYRTPGYPLLVAALRAHVPAIRLTQACLDTLTILAAYLLARRWLPANACLFAAALVAFNPFLIYFSALLLSETLYVAMLTWGMVLLVWRRSFLPGAVLLAMGILVRPGALLLPVFLAFGGHLGSRRFFADSRPTRLPIGSTTLLLIALVLAPWVLRNRGVLHQWVLLSTNAGVTRYDGFNPDATGASDQSFLSSPRFALLGRCDEVERDRFLGDLASQWTRQVWQSDPRRLAELTVRKIARTWSPIPLSREFGGRPAYLAAALLYSIPLDILVVVQLAIGRLPRGAKAYLLTPALYLTVVGALSVGSLRYRIPAEPAMAVLAAAVLVRRPRMQAHE